jgi:hypothetical protein
MEVAAKRRRRLKKEKMGFILRSTSISTYALCAPFCGRQTKRIWAANSLFRLRLRALF